MLQNTAVTKNGWKNDLMSRMLFSELYKIIVNESTFVGFRQGDCPNRFLNQNCVNLVSVFHFRNEGYVRPG